MDLHKALPDYLILGKQEEQDQALQKETEQGLPFLFCLPLFLLLFPSLFWAPTCVHGAGTSPRTNCGFVAAAALVFF